MTTVGGLEVIGQAWRGFVKCITDPARAQLLAALAQPLPREGVVQHHLAVTAAQYAQRHRRGLNHVAAEQFAFHQRLNALDRRGDETMLQTTDQQAHQADTQHAEQQRAEHLRPQGAQYRQQVDGVSQLPVRGFQLLAQHQLLGQPAIADEAEEILLSQQWQVLFGRWFVAVAEQRFAL
ncbi:hypothetical protein D3C81_1315500 [compost metagenome]